jgi:hypothetical protein
MKKPLGLWIRRLAGGLVISRRFWSGRDSRGSSIRTIHLAFTLPSAPAVSLLPLQPFSILSSHRFTLPFDPDYGFAVIGMIIGMSTVEYQLIY